MSQNDMPNVGQLRSNAAQRTPCVLVLDGSASMSGPPILEVNKALPLLEADLKSDDLARVQSSCW